ncbi:uncharacterized protein BJ212DRAFT_1298129 [Suillus subaureus]|uniref:Uncharacterized protein n=1 Tax=Suillus subaureus TaxID=48587 RepID=A0A9P7EFB7_9AGAM|nr:uncharacterized protein BJ212DRAFT_1298129 [Suillus subaureus]KAG1819691.1 hypothetical protein BJ212DRAFT_1298129 [Suillus subaureus]
MHRQMTWDTGWEVLAMEEEDELVGLVGLVESEKLGIRAEPRQPMRAGAVSTGMVVTLAVDTYSIVGGAFCGVVLVAAGATYIKCCRAVSCYMSVPLTFSAPDGLTFVLGDCNAFILDANAFFEDEDCHMGVCNVNQCESLALGCRSVLGGLDPEGVILNLELDGEVFSNDRCSDGSDVPNWGVWLADVGKGCLHFLDHVSMQSAWWEEVVTWHGVK